MKIFFLGLVSLALSTAVYAQTYSTVTINVMGNRNTQLILDGTTHDISPLSNAGDTRTPLVLTNLPAGQHTLEVVNTQNEGANLSTVFRIRSGYDMQITVRNNGTIQLRETKSSSTSVSGHPGLSRQPMTSATFNTLLQSIRRQTSQRSKLTAVSNAINSTRNYFTTTQLELLVSQVNSQTNRLQLLKSGYLKVTDPANFTELVTLLNSQTSKDALLAHVNTYNYNYGTASTSSHNAYMSAMSDANFNTIFRAAQNQTNATLRMNYVLDALANANNYFTSYQARNLIQLVSGENNRLILAKTAYRGIVDASNFGQVSNLLSTYASRQELQNYINTYQSGSTSTYRVPMTADRFNAVYRDIQDEVFLGAKMNGLTNLFANASNYFTTAQARQLILLVSAESNRLELAKAAYDNITDPTNFNQIYDVLASQASRNDLSNYINSTYGVGSVPVTTKVAMSTDSYNTIYRGVQNTWGFGAKMNSLTTIFNNTSYYFTVDQAKRLIELVSAESNRLQLAKAAYRQIVDTENFANIYPILESQASRDELAAYVRQLGL